MAKNGEAPHDLYIAAYSDGSVAEEAWNAVRLLAADKVIEVEALALVNRDSDGKIHVSNGSPPARADRDGQEIGLRVVSAGGWQRRVGRAENLSVRRGGRRCLCGACEPVCQHGAEGRHENRGLLP